jgi:hypothetical protein
MEDGISLRHPTTLAVEVQAVLADLDSHAVLLDTVAVGVKRLAEAAKIGRKTAVWSQIASGTGD